jgi:hypothetical protein
MPKPKALLARSRLRHSRRAADAAVVAPPLPPSASAPPALLTFSRSLCLARDLGAQVEAVGELRGVLCRAAHLDAAQQAACLDYVVALASDSRCSALLRPLLLLLSAAAGPCGSAVGAAVVALLRGCDACGRVEDDAHRAFVWLALLEDRVMRDKLLRGAAAAGAWQEAPIALSARNMGAAVGGLAALGWGAGAAPAALLARCDGATVALKLFGLALGSLAPGGGEPVAGDARAMVAHCRAVLEWGAVPREVATAAAVALCSAWVWEAGSGGGIGVAEALAACCGAEGGARGEAAPGGGFAWLRALPPLARLSLLRALLITVPTPALVAGATPPLAALGAGALAACAAGDVALRVAGFQTAETWLAAVRRCSSCDEGARVVASLAAPPMLSLLDALLANWESPSRRLATLVGDVFDSLCGAVTALPPPLPAGLSGGALLARVLALPLGSGAWCAALQRLVAKGAPLAPAPLALLRTHPDLLPRLFTAAATLVENGGARAATITALLSGARRALEGEEEGGGADGEAPARAHARWAALWTPHVTALLLSPYREVRLRAVAYAARDVVVADAGNGALLCGALRRAAGAPPPALAREGDDGSAVGERVDMGVAAVAKMLRASGRAAVEGDDGGCAAVASGAELARWCRASDPELRVLALEVVAAFKGTAARAPPARELALAAAWAAANGSLPQFELRKRALRAYATIFSRLLDAAHAAEKHAERRGRLSGEAAARLGPPPPPPDVPAAAAFARALALGGAAALYPGSPAERVAFPLALLGAAAAAFSGCAADAACGGGESGRGLRAVLGAAFFAPLRSAAFVGTLLNLCGDPQERARGGAGVLLRAIAGGGCGRGCARLPGFDAPPAIEALAAWALALCASPRERESAQGAAVLSTIFSAAVLRGGWVVRLAPAPRAARAEPAQGDPSDAPAAFIRDLQAVLRGRALAFAAALGAEGGGTWRGGGGGGGGALAADRVPSDEPPMGEAAPPPLPHGAADALKLCLLEAYACTAFAGGPGRAAAGGLLRRSLELLEEVEAMALGVVAGGGDGDGEVMVEEEEGGGEGGGGDGEGGGGGARGATMLGAAEGRVDCAAGGALRAPLPPPPLLTGPVSNSVAQLAPGAAAALAARVWEGRCTGDLHALAREAGGSGPPPGSGGGGDGIAPHRSAHALVIAAWLATREAVRARAALLCTLPFSCDAAAGEGAACGWALPPAAPAAALRGFVGALLALRHVGSIAATGEALQALCARVLVSAGLPPALTGAPRAALRSLLSRLAFSSQFILRRSAGFGVAFAALLRAEPRNAPPALLLRALTRLLRLAGASGEELRAAARARGAAEGSDDDGGGGSSGGEEEGGGDDDRRSAGSGSGDDSNGDGGGDGGGGGCGGGGAAHHPPNPNPNPPPRTPRQPSSRARVHALNVLCLLFRDGALGDLCGTYLPAALCTAVGGFSSPSWAVRNSCMMLFAAAADRALGTAGKNAAPPRAGAAALRRTPPIDERVSAASFFTRYAALAPLLTAQLRAAVAGGLPSLYPLLLLFSRLRGGGGGGQAGGGDLCEALTAALEHPSAPVRALAAGALAGAAPPDVLAAALARALAAAGSFAGAAGANRVHGLLLASRAALLACACVGAAGGGALPQLARAILEAAPPLIAARSSPLPPLLVAEALTALNEAAVWCGGGALEVAAGAAARALLAPAVLAPLLRLPGGAATAAAAGAVAAQWALSSLLGGGGAGAAGEHLAHLSAVCAHGCVEVRRGALKRVKGLLKRGCGGRGAAGALWGLQVELQVAPALLRELLILVGAREVDDACVGYALHGSVLLLDAAGAGGDCGGGGGGDDGGDGGRAAAAAALRELASNPLAVAVALRAAEGGAPPRATPHAFSLCGALLDAAPATVRDGAFGRRFLVAVGGARGCDERAPLRARLAAFRALTRSGLLAASLRAGGGPETVAAVALRRAWPAVLRAMWDADDEVRGAARACLAAAVAGAGAALGGAVESALARGALLALAPREVAAFFEAGARTPPGSGAPPCAWLAAASEWTVLLAAYEALGEAGAGGCVDGAPASLLPLVAEFALAQLRAVLEGGVRGLEELRCAVAEAEAAAEPAAAPPPLLGAPPYDSRPLHRVSFLPAPPAGDDALPANDYAEPLIAGGLAAALWRALRARGAPAPAAASPAWAEVLALALRVAEGASALSVPVNPFIFEGGAWAPISGGADHAPAVFAAARTAECLLREAPWTALVRPTRA